MGKPQTVCPTYQRRTWRERDATRSESPEVSHSPATSPRKGLGNLAVQTFPNVIYIIMAGGTAFHIPGRLLATYLTMLWPKRSLTFLNRQESHYAYKCLRPQIRPDTEKSAESARESRSVRATFSELPTRTCSLSPPLTLKEALSRFRPQTGWCRGSFSSQSCVGPPSLSWTQGADRTHSTASAWQTPLPSCWHRAHTREHVGVPTERQSEAALYTWITRVPARVYVHAPVCVHYAGTWPGGCGGLRRLSPSWCHSVPRGPVAHLSSLRLRS